MSPLSFLPFFDMTWDILADMMHIITGIYKRHICALLQGQRMPKGIKARKKNTARQNSELAAAHEACRNERRERHTTVLARKPALHRDVRTVTRWH